MDQKNEVLRFIDVFTRRGDYQQVTECFTSGCCYWFAHILFYRFTDNQPRPVIMYDPVMNHFGTKINDRIYDITGDVTDKYDWIQWTDMDKDPQWKSRIERDTIRIVSKEEDI